MNKLQTKDVNLLVDRLSKNRKVMAIYLFGSQINGRARRDSDVDIAVLLADSTDKMECDVLLERRGDIDISLFHRLPLSIQFSILKNGRILYCRDKSFCEKVMRGILMRYLDFSSFILRHYNRVYQNV
jgi:predicted nucleotidyltransferase